MGEEAGLKAVWTPLRIIQWAVPYLLQKGIPNPRLDVELLIAHALQMDRLKVYLQFDRPLDARELASIRELLKERSKHVPLQYLIGEREFFGLNFKVCSGILIPRPETELLVEAVLEYLKDIEEEKRLVLDLGTGSGCIAISITKNITCRVWAIDISDKALEIAGVNAKNLGVVDYIQWRQGDWFKALKPGDPPQFCVIACNPPYIPIEEKAELAPEIRDYEPPEALFAEKNGLKAYEELAKGLSERLLPGGTAFFEIHAHSYDKVSSIFCASGWKVSFRKDLQGHPRVIKIVK